MVQFRIRMPESKLAFLYRNTADANVTPASIVVRSVPWSIPCFCDDPDQVDITPVERDNADGDINLFPFPLINIRYISTVRFKWEEYMVKGRYSLNMHNKVFEFCRSFSLFTFHYVQGILKTRLWSFRSI